jgi:hypothetical protein
MYTLYYLRVVDVQFGERFKIGITTNLESRFTSYKRKHTELCRVRVIKEFATKADALAVKRQIVDNHWKARRPGTTDEYYKDVLMLFGDVS